MSEHQHGPEQHGHEQHGHEQSKLWPTFAFRAWLAALLAHTRRVEERLHARIGLHERMVARLREKIERSRAVADSLGKALGTVDDVLRHVRDDEILAEHRGEEHRGAEPPHPGGQHEGSRPGGQQEEKRGGPGRGKPA